MNRPEQAAQIAVVQYLEVLRSAGRLTFFHVENGGYRTPAEGRIGKAMGRRAGVPDLAVFWKPRHAGFIEMKAVGPRKRAPENQAVCDDGRLSAAQKEYLPELFAIGFPIVICHDLQTVRETLVQWQVIGKDEFKIW